MRQILEDKGWVVYQPFTEGAHCFDMLSIKNKKTSVAIDVKAKARLNKWPATGVNDRHFNEYKLFSEKHNMDFWLIFVDEGMRKIYGNTIEALEQPRTVEGNQYPFVARFKNVPTRIWPLEAMKLIADLDDKYMQLLTTESQRAYEYRPEIKETA